MPSSKYVPPPVNDLFVALTRVFSFQIPLLRIFSPVLYSINEAAEQLIDLYETMRAVLMMARADDAEWILTLTLQAQDGLKTGTVCISQNAYVEAMRRSTDGLRNCGDNAPVDVLFDLMFVPDDRSLKKKPIWEFLDYASSVAMATVRNSSAAHVRYVKRAKKVPSSLRAWCLPLIPVMCLHWHRCSYSYALGVLLMPW